MVTPVGLCGRVMLTYFVAGVTSAMSLSGSTRKPSSKVRSRKLTSASMARGVSMLVA